MDHCVFVGGISGLYPSDKLGSFQLIVIVCLYVVL